MTAAPSSVHAKFALPTEHCFARLQLSLIVPLTGADSFELQPMQTKLALSSVLKQVFGTLAVATHPFDLLSHERSHRTLHRYSCIVRVEARSMSTLWGAWAMVTSIDKMPCKVEVQQVGATLMDLASPRYLDL